MSRTIAATTKAIALAGALLVLSLPATTPAQTPPTPTIKIETRIVLLDISVTDANGKPVTDLRPDEFRVYEKKVPQKIVSFEPPSAHELPPSLANQVVVNSTADLPKIGQAPVAIIIIDELNMNFADRAYARDKLIQWLARQPAVLPQPTALLAITYKDFHLLRDYTQDRDALLAIIRKHSGDVVWRQDSTGRTGSQASENMFASLGAIEQVAEATRGLPGRKNLIWVGDGFPSVSMGDVGRTSAQEIGVALRRLSGVLLQARITFSVVGPTIQAIVPQVIETQADQDSANMSEYTGVTLSNDHLQFGGLAPPTGGHAYSGRNDLDAEIGRSIDEGRSYYTLSYRPSDPSDDPQQFRSIRVDVTRPGLTIQTRNGYFPQPKAPAEPPKVPPQQLAFDLYGAAMSSLPYPDLHLSAERNGKLQGQEAFLIHAAARDMTWRDLPDGRRHTDLVLLAVCLSANNKMLAKNFATLGSTSEASLASINVVTASLPMHFNVPPGTARIRFVVRDMVGGRVGATELKP